MPWRQMAMKDVASCDKLRGAAKRAVIRRSPNGETRLSKPQSSPGEYIARVRRTWGSETSQYPQEKKSKRDSPSSGERKGSSPNQRDFGFSGVEGPRCET